MPAKPSPRRGPGSHVAPPREGEPVLDARTDEDIAQDAKDLIALSQEVNVSNLVVRSNRGVVVLRGVVTSDDERAAAERITRNVPGVVDVVDEIIVVPTGQAPSGPR